MRHPKILGLARAFMTGLEKAVTLGADIIVNTDADNQYNADDIPILVKPILEGKAEIVIGERPISTTAHFSPAKKFLQKLGSKVVRMASNTSIPDAPSGFRAFGRQAAKKLHVFNEYTYTLETIIQAGQKGIAIESVPVRTNEDLRKSRLVKSIHSYVFRSMSVIIRVFMTYKPFPFFAVPGMVFFFTGLLLGFRFLFFFFFGDGEGRSIRSIIGSAYYYRLFCHPHRIRCRPDIRQQKAPGEYRLESQVDRRTAQKVTFTTTNTQALHRYRNSSEQLRINRPINP